MKAVRVSNPHGLVLIAIFVKIVKKLTSRLD
jgi:hypothetical protein